MKTTVEIIPDVRYFLYDAESDLEVEIFFVKADPGYDGRGIFSFDEEDEDVGRDVIYIDYARCVATYRVRRYQVLVSTKRDHDEDDGRPDAMDDPRLPSIEPTTAAESSDDLSGERSGSESSDVASSEAEDDSVEYSDDESEDETLDEFDDDWDFYIEDESGDESTQRASDLSSAMKRMICLRWYHRALKPLHQEA